MVEYVDCPNQINKRQPQQNQARSHCYKAGVNTGNDIYSFYDYCPGGMQTETNNWNRNRNRPNSTQFEEVLTIRQRFKQID